MRFLQHCESSKPALRGYFRYDASDQTTPPAPGDPAAFPWHPPAGAVPATGDYVYLQGAPGEAIIGDHTELFRADAGSTLSLTNTYGVSRNVSVGIHDADDDFSIWMFGQSNRPRLTTGLYSSVQRAPSFYNPTAGGFSAYGDGSGCNTLVATFAVDRIGYDAAGHVTSISARFVQRCPDASAPPLYGAVRIG